MSLCENLDGQCGASWCNCDEVRKKAKLVRGRRINTEDTQMSHYLKNTAVILADQLGCDESEITPDRRLTTINHRIP